MSGGMDGVGGPLVLARHDLSRGRPDRALATLERVTGPTLETREFWTIRARALGELRAWDKAVEAARVGLEREPGDMELLSVLALAELELGDKKQARATIDAAVTRYPESAVLHAQRGLILARSAQKSFRLASFKKARAAVDEALRLDPYCEPALLVRAHIAMLSRDQRAAEYGAELLSLGPEDEQVHLIAGSALARRGDVSSGLEHYVEAARLDPSDPGVAWLGRRSRVLQGRFAAPLRFAERLTRGRLPIVWVFVALGIWATNQPVLIAAMLAFWAYMWGVRLYVRIRVGKAPK
jgi:tetratricopeptide (TPR) repeat protein